VGERNQLKWAWKRNKKWLGHLFNQLDIVGANFYVFSSEVCNDVERAIKNCVNLFEGCDNCPFRRLKLLAEKIHEWIEDEVKDWKLKGVKWRG